jgi:hypothetical protein
MNPIQPQTYLSQNEAYLAIAKLPDSHKHHVESFDDGKGILNYRIVDNKPDVAKKGNAAAVASLLPGSSFKSNAEADRFYVHQALSLALSGFGGRHTAASGTLKGAGKAAGTLAEGAAKAVSVGGRLEPAGWAKYLGPISMAPVFTPAGKETLKQGLQDLGKAIGPALKPLPPPTLSPEAKETIKQGFKDASKQLGPLIALPGFQEKAKEVGTKAKAAVEEVARDVGKALLFGPFLPGIVIGEAIAKKR